MAPHLDIGPRALPFGWPLLLMGGPSGIKGWVKCGGQICLCNCIITLVEYFTSTMKVPLLKWNWREKLNLLFDFAIWCRTILLFIWKCRTVNLCSTRQQPTKKCTNWKWAKCTMKNLYSRWHNSRKGTMDLLTWAIIDMIVRFICPAPLGIRVCPCIVLKSCSKRSNWHGVIEKLLCRLNCCHGGKASCSWRCLFFYFTLLTETVEVREGVG